VLVDDLPIAAVEISLHGLALGIQAKATFAPSPGEDPVVADKLAVVLDHDRLVTNRRPCSVKMKAAGRALRSMDGAKPLYGWGAAVISPRTHACSAYTFLCRRC
jgi:hypothetical protein